MCNHLMRGPLTNLSVEDFGISVHRYLFGLMLELNEDGVGFDPLAICSAARERGLLDKIGGEAYVTDLPDGTVPDPGLIARHVATIQRYAGRRRIAAFAELILHRALQPRENPELILHDMRVAVDSLLAGCDLDGNLLPHQPRDLAWRPDLQHLSQVEAKAVNWFWKPYLPFGMLTMLSGDPGVGKSYIALSVAAAITTGRVPYTGGVVEPGNVVCLTVENSPEYVLRPRYDSLGGDPKRFVILRGAISGKPEKCERRGVTLADVSLLREALERTQARLVLIDPIQSYFGTDVDTHKASETRPILDGLARVAEDSGSCFLLTRHLSKAPTGRAIHRGLGSIDLTGAVRTELLAGRLPDDPTQRALVQIKSNLGEFGPPLGFVIEADGSFRWTGAIQITAAELLAPDSVGSKKTKGEDGCDFLRSRLQNGPVRVEVLTKESGMNDRTLRRSAYKLGVVRHREGNRGPVTWELPTLPDKKTL
jgi:hypothetical protein